MPSDELYPEFDWWKGWEDLDQIQSPAAVLARPRGLGSLGRGSYFAEPYTIRSPHRVYVGDGVKVSERLFLAARDGEGPADHGGSFHIGDGCMIGADFYAYCADDVVIGSGVGISARVAIGDVVTNMNPDAPDGKIDTGFAPVRICDGAIIGLGAIILPGVTIGERAAVGAGSVVTRDVAPGCLAFGNPARILGSWDAETGAWISSLRVPRSRA
jgi:acetyltransferase-like isoleucine patch superfamily enzyme